MSAKRQTKTSKGLDINEYLTESKTSVLAVFSREDYAELGIFKGDMIFVDSERNPNENELVLTASRKIVRAVNSRKSFQGLYLAAKNGQKTAFVPISETIGAIGVIVGMCRKMDNQQI